ncbi:sugar transferase [Flagellimonas pacifica]|uniref:Sugar transferase involved in LPS biosynthesis (Colanic, teichoic acid) n=1 Tax=Flagellimonas pacifica TaxID=1247520 RepID=A0A285MR36_9FLAO|nr:sugar transferase [Allomuricauda parva]SNY99625.1 Sugar transferase involved in LPS biosynthesis (colanic, teichoic acid) [Allomuricauda parva]
MIYSSFFKRIFDLVLSVVGFVILLPVFITIWIILLFVNNGKPFFLQPRPGKNEKVFNILKFKSMTDKRDENGKLLPDELRVTKFGTFLRKSSLDEIPQLLSIIKGDMSLIGPRPLRVRYLPYYTKEEQIRHTVRPGVTGLAQISGRNLLDWDKRLQKDIEYVNNLSFGLDIQILFKTVLKVLSNNDVALDSESGMIDFDEERKNKTSKKTTDL